MSAELQFNWFGYRHEAEIKTLRESYTTAHNALMLQLEQAFDDIDDYDNRRAASVLEPFEADELLENGEVLVSYRSLLVHRAEAFHDHVRAFKKAYVIMLYHAWEHGARRWTRKHSTKFPALVRDVQAFGICVSPDLIDVYCCANALKHNNGVWGFAFCKLVPSCSPINVYNIDGDIDWHELIEITDRDMNRFFEIVAQSGPTVASDRWWTDGEEVYTPY